jgi:hypothetical protein
MAAPVSQLPSALSFPEPEPADSEAVSESLRAAHVELARNEQREALRLLRQAAEAAEAAGNDLRALALARAAADLANEMGSSLTPPPPASYVMPVASPAKSLEPELAALVASGRAVRVQVKRSARDEELYIVRQPSDGKPVLEGRDALILLIEPDSEFFSKK